MKWGKTKPPEGKVKQRFQAGNECDNPNFKHFQ